MDYCTPHFGKPLHEVTLNDLNALFAARKSETDQLELKSFGGLGKDHYIRITSICRRHWERDLIKNDSKGNVFGVL